MFTTHFIVKKKYFHQLVIVTADKQGKRFKNSFVKPKNFKNQKSELELCKTKTDKKKKINNKYHITAKRLIKHKIYYLYT